jgi:hypothetical protein
MVISIHRGLLRPTLHSEDIVDSRTSIKNPLYLYPFCVILLSFLVTFVTLCVLCDFRNPLPFPISHPHFPKTEYNSPNSVSAIHAS